MANQQGLPVSKLISVSVTLTPGAAQGADLNSAMIVGDSSVIDVVTRYRSYSDIDEVATDFGTTAPEYFAAVDFFSQNPQPTQLYIGRWAEAATPGELFGGPLTAPNLLISAWTGITTGAFYVIIDGVPYNAVSLNFSAASNLNAVASDIQTELNILDAGTTCIWDSVNERFVITSPTTGTSSSVSFLQTPTAFGFIGFSGQPSPNDTVTVDGTVVTFVAAGASGPQVNIGTDEAHSIANLLAFLTASVDANISLMTYFNTGTKIYCVSKLTGTTGDSYTLAKSGANLSVSGSNLTGGSGVDISTMLAGKSTSSGAYLANGIAAESALAAVVILDSLNVSWYALAFAAGTNNSDLSDNDVLSIAAYIEADSKKHLFGVTSSEGATLLSNDTTSIAYLLKQLAYKRTFVQYSSTDAYAGVSLIGRGVTVDFNGSNTTLNFQYQQEPGVEPEFLSTTQSDALDSKNCSYYAEFNNGKAIIVNGKTASGFFIDEIWNSDWFANRIQTDLFNVLYTAGTKIPQTDAGMHTLATTIDGSCQAAVANGFLGAGTWNSAGFGTLVEGQFMPTGYYIFQPPVATQNQAARAARQSVPFQVAAKEAGAVNNVLVAVTVNQ